MGRREEAEPSSEEGRREVRMREGEGGRAGAALSSGRPDRVTSMQVVETVRRGEE